ncbi:MAG: winged helix-turn-helix transcriptional regulator [Clostridiales bacterium]|jgi:hypothetical protein|nr:winged helix-turn-helix transcriptional regulator [Clostridiales bacterium]
MNYLAQPGILMDVIGYTMIYFNQNALKYREKIFSNQEEDPFTYFDLFRAGKRKIDPPAKLYPFFYYDPKSTNLTLMFKYLWETHDFSQQRPADFFASLCGEAFRRFCIEYYLIGYQNELDINGVLAGDMKSCLHALSLLNTHGNNLVYFVDFFQDFESLAASLSEYMSYCFNKIEAFHEKLVPEMIDRIFEEYIRYESIIKRMYEIQDNMSIAEEYFTIHLMEHLALFHKPAFNGINHLFFIGASSRQTITRWSDYTNISIISFGQSFGNEVKYDIIQELRKGEHTVSQLAKKLYIARSTVDRYLLSLCENLVVQVSRKAGTEIYYKLNGNYMLAAKEEVKRILDDICADITGSD